MNNLPFVSVVIPVFNDLQGLQKCISALILQTYEKNLFEIIVIDNGSDKTPKLSNMPSSSVNIRIAFCQKPGSYAARNVGAKVAQGEVIAFTDADCLPDPDWIRNGVTTLNNSGQNYIVGGEIKLLQSQHPTAVELYQCLTGFAQKENIELRRFTATANLFVNKQHFIQIGEFDEDLLSGGDREWCWRAEKLGFKLIYAQHASVSTYPRRSIHAAIKQARRVTGGRYHLRSLGVIDSAEKALRLGQRRSAINSINWLLKNSKISYWDRFRVLAVATFLRVVQSLEMLLLKLGSKPERR